MTNFDGEPNERIISETIADAAAFLDTPHDEELGAMGYVENYPVCENQVVEALRSKGVIIRVPEEVDVPIFELMMVLADSREIAEENQQPGINRMLELMYFTTLISHGLHSYESTRDDPLKPKLQIEIVDNQSLHPLDKAVLMNVYDELVPVPGVRMVSPERVLAIKAQLAAERVDGLYRERASDLMDTISATELLPTFGDHDNQVGLKTKIVLHVMEQRYANRGAMPLPLVGRFFKEAVSAAEAMGMPKLHVENIVNRIQYELFRQGL